MASAWMTLSQLVYNFLHDGHVRPNFPHTLIGVGKFCDADCNVIFGKYTVPIFYPNNDTILAGWCERTDARLWNFALIPDHKTLLAASTDNTDTILIAFRAYDLLSVSTIILYLHTAAGFLLRST